MNPLAKYTGLANAIEFWRFQSSIRPNHAHMMPAVASHEVVSKPGVFSQRIHASIPRSSGHSVGVTTKPVPRLFMRGADTVTVNFPFSWLTSCASYSTGPHAGNDRSETRYVRNVRTGIDPASSIRVSSSSSSFSGSAKVKLADWLKSALLAAP